MVKHALATWKRHGLVEVQIDVHVVSCPAELLKPGVGPALHAADHGFALLTEDAKRELLAHLEDDPRTRILAAPNVRIVHGTRVVVRDQVKRPFVTDVVNGQPVVEIFSEGLWLALSTVVQADGETQLDFQLVHSEITDVRTKEKTGVGEEDPVIIQEVDLGECRMETRATVPVGRWVAVLGSEARGDKESPTASKLLVLFTPRVEKANLGRSFQLPGVGINSDAGLTGVIVIRDKNFGSELD